MPTEPKKVKQFVPGGRQAEVDLDGFLAAVTAEMARLPQFDRFAYLIHAQIKGTNFAATESNIVIGQLAGFAEECAVRIRESLP